MKKHWLIGGVALNTKVVRAIEKTLGMPVSVPRHAEIAGAIGAALLADNAAADITDIHKASAAEKDMRPPLMMTLSDFQNFRFSPAVVAEGEGCRERLER